MAPTRPFELEKVELKLGRLARLPRFGKPATQAYLGAPIQNQRPLCRS